MAQPIEEIRDAEWAALWAEFDRWAETAEYASSRHRWNAARDKIRNLVETTFFNTNQKE